MPWLIILTSSVVSIDLQCAEALHRSGDGAHADRTRGRWRCEALRRERDAPGLGERKRVPAHRARIARLESADPQRPQFQSALTVCRAGSADKHLAHDLRPGSAGVIGPPHAPLDDHAVHARAARVRGRFGLYDFSETRHLRRHDPIAQRAAVHRSGPKLNRQLGGPFPSASLAFDPTKVVGSQAERLN